MIGFIFKRCLLALPVFFIVVSASFLLMRIAPGSPFGADRKLDAEVEAHLLKRFALDGSLQHQFVSYWKNLAEGNFGDSIKYRNRSVAEIIGQSLPKSLAVGSAALALALLIGIVAGSYAAVHHNSRADRIAMLLALAGICIPAFVLAPLLVLLFGILIPIFPVAGWGTAAHYVLPVLCLSLPYGAYCARLMRTSMLEVLQQDFIRTAHAKGIHSISVIYHHALRVAILPLVSYAGPLAAGILTGSFVVEDIFKIPGMGTFFVNAVINRDVFLEGGCVIIYFSLLIALNLLTDVLLGILDRRVRLW